MKKNIILIALLASSLTSCSKMDDVLPEPREQDQTVSVHVYTDNSLVDLYVNGVYHSVGSRNGQGVKVINVDTLKTLEAYRWSGKKSSLTVYKGNTRYHYGDFTYIRNAPKL